MNTKPKSATQTVSFLAPFRSRAFLILWLATVISNVGTWMHDIAASWLMTSMTNSSTMVALIQTATMLPIFLFALPAGALADIVDRRRMLLVIQSFLFLIVLALVAVVIADTITPPLLILFTFLIGTGTAFLAPAWQAIVPELVDKKSFTQAVALNGVGINISRAIGPALAGLIIVQIGNAAVFFVNAASFIVVIAALLWWRRPKDTPNGLPKEAIFSAMSLGFRYARHSTALKDTLFRALTFFISASAFWALLPVIAKIKLEASAESFGLMMAAIGLGAVIGSFALPKLKARFSSGRIVTLSSVLSAALLVLASINETVYLMLVLCAMFGASWIWVLASLNVSAQMALPTWVRARGLAVYLMVFFGAMSAGSLLWGGIADSFSIDTSLIIAGLALLAGTLASHKRVLNQGEALDLAPANHWPEPAIVTEQNEQEQQDRSPVLIMVEYRVANTQREAFLNKIHLLREARLRYGAYQWSCLQDNSDPEKYLETFKETSWLNHLRHHKRVAGEDKTLQDELRALTIDGSTHVRHFLGA